MVERRRIELYKEKERFSGRMRMIIDDPVAEKASSSSSLIHKHGSGINYSAYSGQVQLGTGNLQNKKLDVHSQANFQGLKIKDALQPIAPSALALSRKRQVLSQVSSLPLFNFFHIVDNLIS